MITVGRKWPKSARGDYCAHCDYCGVRWRRGQMTRDASGKLACPDDARGRDDYTLGMLNAEGAAEVAGYVPRDNDGGSYFRTDVNEPSPIRRTREDI
jgi:hypothetical protein